MGNYLARLGRPYDFNSLIEVYARTKRSHVPHSDFRDYYSSLLAALEPLFGVRLTREGLSFHQRVLWMRFASTVDSLLRITTPWDNTLEDGLLHTVLRGCGDAGQRYYRAAAVVGEATLASEAAHREMLAALFVAIFGGCPQVVTSEELRGIGFDDSREPDISDYFDCL